MAELPIAAGVAGLLIFDGDDPFTYIVCDTAEDLEAAFAAVTVAAYCGCWCSLSARRRTARLCVDGRVWTSKRGR